MFFALQLLVLSDLLQRIIARDEPTKTRSFHSKHRAHFPSPPRHSSLPSSRSPWEELMALQLQVKERRAEGGGGRRRERRRSRKEDEEEEEERETQFTRCRPASSGVVRQPQLEAAQQVYSRVR